MTRRCCTRTWPPCWVVVGNAAAGAGVVRQAVAFVAAHHRHRRPPVGMKFAVGATDPAGRLVAVAGRPIARMLDDGTTIEITRLCTLDGARNAASLLYAAIRRAAAALGYQRVLTYTRVDEPGTSIRAAGWISAADVPARGWHRPSRPRPTGEVVGRVRWEAPMPTGTRRWRGRR
jgi:hypothetical protein